MSISDLYSSGKHKRDLGHFANIIKIAKVNNIITDKEQQLITKVAKRLNIGEQEYKEILENPEKYPLNPPVDYNARIERLYQLTKMIFADGKVTKNEVFLLKKIAVGLHFSIENTEKICDEAIHLVMNNNNLDDFTSAIKKIAAT